MKIGIIMGCLLGILALGIVSTDYSGTALAQESIEAVCPGCGEKGVLRKGMGVTPFKKAMSCPDCKGKGAEHTCDKCGANVMACPACKKAIALVGGGPAAICPACTEATKLRKGMGMTAREQTMVCPDCKGEGAAHACEKCGAEVATCPRCVKLLTAGPEEVKAVCPQCKAVRTLRKGMGPIALQRTMKCPHCEKPVKGLGTHVCEECGEQVAVCPICKETI
ncbi:MAG: hypothetical protein ACYSRP_06615 [Planctomycetota bacterium]|jgi:predicted RNA-binding Zn-ribbon protein involved in translation (DUF1610 family)